eukprot:2613702-Rhodomonas_salina.2
MEREWSGDLTADVMSVASEDDVISVSSAMSDFDVISLSSNLTEDLTRRFVPRAFRATGTAALLDGVRMMWSTEGPALL